MLCKITLNLTVGLDGHYEPTKKTISRKTRRVTYDNSKTTVGKLSTRKNQICRVYLSVIIVELLFFKTSENMAQTKIDPADLDLPCLILVCKVSDPSEVSRFVRKLIFSWLRKSS